jgi:hypothetical protein
MDLTAPAPLSLASGADNRPGHLGREILSGALFGASWSTIDRPFSYSHQRP